MLCWLKSGLQLKENLWDVQIIIFLLGCWIEVFWIQKLLRKVIRHGLSVLLHDYYAEILIQIHQNEALCSKGLRLSFQIYVTADHKNKISQPLSETTISRHSDPLTFIILPEERVR